MEEVRQELLDTFFSADGAGRNEGEGRAGVRNGDRRMLLPTKLCTTLAKFVFYSTRMQVHGVRIPAHVVNTDAALRRS